MQPGLFAFLSSFLCPEKNSPGLTVSVISIIIKLDPYRNYGEENTSHVNTTHSEEVLEMLKVLADSSRLAIIRLLNQAEYSVGDLARLVDLGEPTVSHHLTRLREVGLVNLRTAGNQRFYKANQAGLARFKRLVGKIEQMPEAPAPTTSDNNWIAALGWEPAAQQVLRDYTQDGKLTTIPSKQKKLLVVLQWLATLFERERLYSEAEVNTILKSAYEQDFVSLRRDMVDLGFLRRERGGGKYWLAPAGSEIDRSTPGDED